MEETTKILEDQIKALRDLIAIKDQIIWELRSKQSLTPIFPTAPLFPQPYQPINPWFPSPFGPTITCDVPATTAGYAVINKNGVGIGIAGQVGR